MDTEDEKENEEKWLKHYSSNQRILLVGEGDFSFSTNLAFHSASASASASASHIVATSLDSYDILVGKYKEAKWNLQILLKLGASVLHGVDATKMRLHSDLKMQKFDRIIFNFPHAGFHGKEDDIRLIMKHRKLVLGFFTNARGMLRADGEIHVTHKTSLPFSRWNIAELAWRNSLGLIDCVDFKIEDYPGYNNKRGDSRMRRCDEPFPLGRCSTFKFRFFPAINKISRVKMQVDNTHMRSELSNGYSFKSNYPPTPFRSRRPETCLSRSMDVVLQMPLPIGRSIGSNLHGFAYRTPRFDYERSTSMAEAFGRSHHSRTNPIEDQYQRYPFGIRGSRNAPDKYFSHASGEACASIYGQNSGGAQMWEYERSVESDSGRLQIELNVVYQNAENAKAFGFQHYE